MYGQSTHLSEVMHLISYVRTILIRKRKTVERFWEYSEILISLA
jgi:hypothetical protein